MQLIVPKPRQIIAPGYSKQVQQWAYQQTDYSLLDEYKRQISALAKYFKDKKQKGEAEAAARYIEIRIGELLGKPIQTHPGKNASLASEPLSKDDRHKFRILAENKEKVEELLEDGITSRSKLLTAVNEQKNKSISITNVDFRLGDFRETLADLTDNSIDLILTDPPYNKKSLVLYRDLGVFAANKLKPGGSLVCYTGQSILPEVFNALGESLRYWWTFALTHSHGGQQMIGKNVIIEWKPVVWFVREFRGNDEFLADRIRGTAPDKTSHEWAQGIGEAIYVIKKLTNVGDLVVDPFAGSGSFLAAASNLGRIAIGSDIPHE